MWLWIVLAQLLFLFTSCIVYLALKAASGSLFGEGEELGWWEVPALEPVQPHPGSISSGTAHAKQSTLRNRKTAMTVAGQDMSCRVCGAKGSTKNCGKCKTAIYCSKDCQIKDWHAKHKGECDSMRETHLKKMKQMARTAAAVNKQGEGEAAKPAAKKEEENEEAPVPKQVIFPYNNFLKLFRAPGLHGPPHGIANTGNSCFANALLQCMLHTRPLAAYLRSQSHSYTCPKPDKSTWCVTCEMEDLCRQGAEAGKREVLSAAKITRHIKKIAPHFSPGRQEDAHDLFINMVDKMEAVMLLEQGGREAFDPRSRETTLMGHIFNGWVRKQIVCPECGAISQRFDTKTGLELQITGSSVHSLEAAFAADFADEVLDGENKYRCSKCKNKVCATLVSGLEVAPNVLVVCLKRFALGRFGKITKRVVYGEELDLEPYMAPGAMDQKPATYKLFGVVVHHDSGGSTMFGHYVSYVKKDDGSWWYCNDSSVSQADRMTALSQQAYMLFYVRDEPRDAPDPNFRRTTTPLGGARQHMMNGHSHDHACSSPSSGASTALANGAANGTLPTSSSDVSSTSSVAVHTSDMMSKVHAALSSGQVELPWPEAAWELRLDAPPADAKPGEACSVSAVLEVLLPGVLSSKEVAVEHAEDRILLLVPNRYVLVWPPASPSDAEAADAQDSPAARIRGYEVESVEGCTFKRRQGALLLQLQLRLPASAVAKMLSAQEEEEGTAGQHASTTTPDGLKAREHAGHDHAQGNGVLPGHEAAPGGSPSAKEAGGSSQQSGPTQAEVQQTASASETDAGVSKQDDVQYSAEERNARAEASCSNSSSCGAATSTTAVKAAGAGARAASKKKKKR